ncbi:hypothetical protein [Phocaeicola vulgatus]|jgi:hypothetical protein|uniref:hypothetical protein n=2 Tax=Bacteroidaceae TaxID=815 RepID=UPI0034A43CAF
MFVKHAGKYAICHNLFLSNAYFTSTITALPSFLPFFRRLCSLFSSANVGRSTSMPNRIAIRMTETGYIAWPVSCPGLAYDATRFILCLPQNREYSPAARKQGKRFND